MWPTKYAKLREKEKFRVSCTMSGILYPDESYAIVGGLALMFTKQWDLEEHKAQVFNYLNASGLKLGILVNFGHYPKLEYERFVLTM